MIYYLKHKNLNVLEMEIDEETSTIVKVLNVIEAEHIPLGVRFEHQIVDRKALNHWFKGRSIPASRENIDRVLEAVGELNTGGLALKCYGLSLSDCYWICPKGSDLDFDKINFFENDFSKDMGEILFGKQLDSFSLVSPDNTSDGWLKKKWIILNEDRYLLKGASGVFRQEPFNEKIAGMVMEKLRLLHVEYEVIFEDGMPYSLCKNFLSKDTELVSAWSVYSHFKKPNHLSAYEHLIESYEKIGITNAVENIEKLMVTDFLIANTDRHMNNFGIVRNSNTLEVLGAAPIFDSGTSLFMSMPTKVEVDDIESKPFAKTHKKQIKLVSDLKKFDIESVLELREGIRTIISQNPFMDEERIDFVIKNFDVRVRLLLELMQEQRQMQSHEMI